MTTARLRIVSDLHVGEYDSRVREVAQIAPLLEGTDRLVLNGDTIETRFLDLDPAARARHAAFLDFAEAHRERLTVITGNHDPDVSPLHHLDLEDGRLLVTHGDTLFPELAPWGWEAAHFRTEQERRLAALPADLRDTWETRLRISKETALALRDLSPHYPGHYPHPWLRHLGGLLGFARIHRILQTWCTAPAAAARLAARFRPEARIAIIGHVHRPGVWRREGRIVINTGSAVPPLGALAVDLVGERLRVRRLRFGRDGATVGATVREIDLAETFARPPEGPSAKLAPSSS